MVFSFRTRLSNFTRNNFKAVLSVIVMFSSFNASGSFLGINISSANALQYFPSLTRDPNFRFRFTHHSRNLRNRRTMSNLSRAITTKFLRSRVLWRRLLFFMTFRFNGINFHLNKSSRRFYVLILSNFTRNVSVLITINNQNIIRITSMRRQFNDRRRRIFNYLCFLLTFGEGNTYKFSLFRDKLMLRRCIVFGLNLLIASCFNGFFRTFSTILSNFRILRLGFNIGSFLITRQICQTIRVRSVIIIRTT